MNYFPHIGPTRLHINFRRPDGGNNLVSTKNAGTRPLQQNLLHDQTVKDYSGYYSISHVTRPTSTKYVTRPTSTKFLCDAKILYHQIVSSMCVTTVLLTVIIHFVPSLYTINVHYHSLRATIIERHHY